MKATQAIHNGSDDELICRLEPDSRIKLIGLGGVGCIVLQYLGMFLKSLDIPVRLALVDGDSFEPSNESRMSFREMGNKAEIKAVETVKALDGGEVSVFGVPEFVDAGNIERLIRDGDIVLLCVDNHQTRRLVAEHCGRLNDAVLLSGGNDGVDPPRTRGTYGNVQIHVRRGGRDLTAPLMRFHPEIARAEGELPVGPHCGQLAESMPQILFANLAVAGAMLNTLFAYACGRVGYQEIKFDILEGRSLPQFPLRREQAAALLPAESD
jgi:hypothetical protein